MLLQTALSAVNSANAQVLADKLYGASIEPAGLQAAAETADMLVKALTTYGAFAVFVVFALEIIRSSIQSDRIDILKIGKAVMLLILLTNYTEVIGVINQTFIDIMADLPKQYLKADMLQQANGNADQANSLSILHFTAMNLVTTLGTGGFVAVIHMTMMLFRKIMLLFLFASGPVAFFLSIIPGFGEGMLKSWFKNYISVQFWAVTILVLDSLFGLYMQAAGKTVSDSLAFAPAYIVFILLYLMVPWLTNKVVGHTAISGFVSKTVGLATSAAMMGVTMGRTAMSKGSRAGGEAAAGALKNDPSKFAGSSMSRNEDGAGLVTFGTGSQQRVNKSEN